MFCRFFFLTIRKPCKTLTCHKKSAISQFNICQYSRSMTNRSNKTLLLLIDMENYILQRRVKGKVKHGPLTSHNINCCITFSIHQGCGVVFRKDAMALASSTTNLL